LRWLFLISGIWGLVVLISHYFMEQIVSHHHPPPITLPEFFYGFVGIGIAWQIALLLGAIRYGSGR
jgi:hypothetical protein